MSKKNAPPPSSPPTATAAAAAATPPPPLPSLDNLNLTPLLNTLAAIDLKPKSASSTSSSEAKTHKFWSTQPVPQQPEAVAVIKAGPLDAPKTVADVRQESYKLPEGYAWVNLDWDEPSVVDEAYTLLTENYVEDDDAMFRFDYSKNFLRWALQPPAWKRNWQVGVRHVASKQLLAMITGTHAHVRVGDVSMPMAEINYLCVHKKLRSKRLAPVLIKEVTRRVNLDNIWQAVYTAGVKIPEPIGVSRYYHRSIDFTKLVEVGFTGLAPRQTMSRMNRLYALPDKIETKGWREIRPEDAPQVAALLRDYLARFHVAIEFPLEEISHWFANRPEVISCYVIEDDKGKITDLASFYHLYSSVIRNPKHSTLRAAYSFYNVPGSVTLKQLLANLLIEAKRQRCDVFNCLNLMENEACFEELRFGMGDGNLHYYLYNWSVGKALAPKEIGVVLM